MILEIPHMDTSIMRERPKNGEKQLDSFFPNLIYLIAFWTSNYLHDLGRYAVTKADLVNAMAEKAGLSKADAEGALKAFTEAITDAMKAGEKVALVGFGTFSVGERSARTGKNPQTGELIEIAAAKVPKFKAGKALKDSVN